MIRSKPSTDVYREAWERVFGTAERPSPPACGFRPPTDETGRALSYEEYCARNGAPFTDEQREVRERLHAFERSVEGGYLCMTKDQRDESWRLSKEIERVDQGRFDALRTTGWDWPE